MRSILLVIAIYPVAPLRLCDKTTSAGCREYSDTDNPLPPGSKAPAGETMHSLPLVLQLSLPTPSWTRMKGQTGEHEKSRL